MDVGEGGCYLSKMLSAAELQGWKATKGCMSAQGWKATKGVHVGTGGRSCSSCTRWRRSHTHLSVSKQNRKYFNHHNVPLTIEEKYLEAKSGVLCCI